MADPEKAKAKILVVDDEPNVLRMVTFTLLTEDYEVVGATNGAEALDKAETEVPDLIILDVMLPDMSGVEVCKQLRQKPETTSVPIIMFSALSQVADKVKSLEAGADEYLTKPITHEELLARVKAILSRFQQLRSSTPKQLGKVIGLIGAKGGVGTTCVALNLASALALTQKNVIAAEIRSCYGTFSALVNLVQPRGLTGLLAINPDRLTERDIRAHLTILPSGLNLLVGPQQVKEYGEIDPQRLEVLIKKLALLADYTILDLPAISSPANETAIQCCDLIALVTEPLATSVSSGIMTIEQLRTWGVQGSRLGAIIVNRAPYAAPFKPEQICAKLGIEIIIVIPTASDVFITAQQAGLPVVIFRPNSDIAWAFNDLLKRISPVEGWLKGL
jgi:DNA-binding response OmpR family regulator